MSGDKFGKISAGGNIGVVGNRNSGTQNFGGAPRIGRDPGPGDVDGANEPDSPSDARPAGGADKTCNVFVVHGRDEQVRRVMYGLLGSLGLRPLEWEELVKATGHTVPFLGDVVANAPAQAQAALVLLTPDDIAMLHPTLVEDRDAAFEGRLTGQPRPNVLLELGMVLMAYPQRTVIVEVGALRPIADLAGRNVIKFDGSTNSIKKIAERLKLAACAVNDTGSDWLDPRPFRNLKAYKRSM